MVGDDGGSLGVHCQVLGQSLHGIHVDLRFGAWDEMHHAMTHRRAKSVARGGRLAHSTAGLALVECATPACPTISTHQSCPFAMAYLHFGAHADHPGQHVGHLHGGGDGKTSQAGGNGLHGTGKHRGTKDHWEVEGERGSVIYVYAGTAA